MTAAETTTSQGVRYFLEVVDVAKSFKGTRVMAGMNFRMSRGELVSLLGPSGCGKTTLLRIIAGLIEADHGDVVVGGRNITQLPAHKRNISVVFQNYALFPHLNVFDNVAFGLRARGHGKAAIEQPVSEALARVRMEDFAERSVAALSGGQQQRIAVARALVVEPDLLLLDEPFSALDRKLRETMQVELKSLLRDSGMTAVFVTHDQEEALAVSDRIAVMNAGKIEQFADPSTLYSRPNSPFVMDFVGLSTKLAGVVRSREGTRLKIDTAVGSVEGVADVVPGKSVLVGVRPELITLDGSEGVNSIDVELEDVTVLGSKTVLRAGSTSHGDVLICELPGIRGNITRGERVSFAWRIEDTLVYEVDT